MNEENMKRLTAITCFSFTFFCFLWVILDYSLLPVNEGQKDFSLLVKDPQWIYVSITGLLSCIYGIYAVMGTYHVYRDSGGFLLFAGSILLVFGIILEMAVLTWNTFIWPVVCANDTYNSFVSEGVFINSIQFKVFFICLLFFLVTGTILTALGILKTKYLGKLVPILLISGIILYGAGEIFSMYIATVGLCIFSLSFLFIGIRLLKK